MSPLSLGLERTPAGLLLVDGAQGSDDLAALREEDRLAEADVEVTDMG